MQAEGRLQVYVFPDPWAEPTDPPSAGWADLHDSLPVRENEVGRRGSRTPPPDRRTNKEGAGAQRAATGATASPYNEGVEANTHRMVHVFAQTPRSALQPFIQRFLVVEFPGFHHDAHLPDICPVAAFSFRGQVRIEGHGWAPQAAFTGPRDTLRAHDHCDEHAVLLATFTPAGASAFLSPPLDELFGATVDLGAVLGHAHELDRLHERLAGAKDHRQRVRLLEDFLIGQVRSVTVDPLVVASVAWLERSTEPARIDDLSRYIGLSQSALERRFRRVIGISPKKVLSIMRLRRAAGLVAGGRNLTTAAHAAGYFDQSHFIHDFHRATGTSPHAFFRRTPAS
jgi:AraC-like DNA-binding protein